MLVDKRKPFFGHKWLIGTLALLIFILVIIRAALPVVVAHMMNDKLRQISPNYTFQLKEIDIQLIRGEYVLKDIKGFLKSSGELFLKVDDVTAYIPFKKFFKPTIVANLVVNRLKLIAYPGIIPDAKKTLLEYNEKSANFTKLKANNVTLRGSQIDFKDFLTTQEDVNKSIHDINAIFRNLNPSIKNPITSFEVTASIFGPAPFRATGLIMLKETPTQWDINAEMRNFNLLAIDQWLKEKWGLKVQSGVADLYSEIESDGEEVDGYIKPFVSELTLKRKIKDEDLALKIPISEKIRITSNIIQNEENLEPGLEDSIGQKGLGIRQSQEYNLDKGEVWQQQQ